MHLAGVGIFCIDVPHNLYNYRYGYIYAVGGFVHIAEYIHVLFYLFWVHLDKFNMYTHCNCT